MRHSLRWSTVTIALAVIVAAAVVSPALGGPSLKKLVKKQVKKEVAKQIVKATGPAGANGANGAPGSARAYGFVTGGGALSRSKNVTGVTHPSTGAYCIALAAGINASTTGLVATPDFFGDSTTGTSTAHTEWDSAAQFCPAGRLEVDTFRVDTSGTTIATDSGGDAVSVPRYTNTDLDEPFFFVVP